MDEIAFVVIGVNTVTLLTLCATQLFRAQAAEKREAVWIKTHDLQKETIDIQSATIQSQDKTLTMQAEVIEDQRRLISALK